jgi:hypothetical protein
VSDNSLPGRAAAERQAGGPFGPHLSSFVSATRKLGYTEWSVRERLRLLGDLERWLGLIMPLQAGRDQRAPRSQGSLRTESA